MNIHPGTDMERVRLVLARELETINQYEQLAREAESPEVRAFFAHLAAEEKEHVAEAVHVLRGLDAKQEAYFAAGVAAGHFEGHAAPASSPAEGAPVHSPGLPAAVQLGKQGFTVGAAHDSTLPSPAPVDPQRVLYSVPAPPTPHTLTVGSLRRRGG